MKPGPSYMNRKSTIANAATDLEMGQSLVNSILDSEDNHCHVGGRGSLYSRLKKFLGEPDESLDPSPTVNSLFSELVSYLQGTGKSKDFGGGNRFADVENAVCTQIDSNELLSSRASAIRSLAIRAESRMELFWAQALLQEDSIPHSCMSAIDKVWMGSGDFPYTQNYVCMVQKESDIIRSCIHCRSQSGTIDCPGSGKAAERLKIAFCGSGPLPLTGILLAVTMDADLTLIDCDPEAIRLSNELIQNWEQREILPSGRIRVMCADGGNVRFSKSIQNHSEVTEKWATSSTVVCDVLFVAALIPNATKEEIAQNVSEMRGDGPLVVLRTAHGLTARLAYFQNRRHIMTRHLDFIGLVAPITHDLGNGKIVDDDVRPMGFFSPEILNSLELFQWQATQA